MLHLMLACLAQVPLNGPEGPIFSNPSNLAQAQFEAAPLNGRGLTSLCAGTAITGSRGETTTTSRNNSVYCRKGGPWDTTIEVGDFVLVGVDTPLVELMPDGTIGVESVGGFTVDSLRSEELDNLAWTSAEAVTTNDATAPNNAVTAERLNDTSAVAQRCTSQIIATTSTTFHVSWVLVRAGTMTKAQIKQVGASNSAGDCTGTITGLVTGSWYPLWCKSSAAYSASPVSVTVSVCVGDTAADQGTVYAWGFNHAASMPSTLAYPPPTFQVVSSNVVSNYSRQTTTISNPVSQTTGSHAASYAPMYTGGVASPVTGPQLIYYDNSGRPAYGPAVANSLRTFDGLNDVANTFSWTAGTIYRVWSSYTGSTMQINDGADTASGSFDGTFGAAALTSMQWCGNNVVGAGAWGMCSRVCGDTDPLRCR